MLKIRLRKKKKKGGAAIRSLIAQKIKENCVHILQQETLKNPKTKKMAEFFEKIQIGDRRILVLGESQAASGEMRNPHENLVKSMRNIPKKEYALVPQINGYSLVLAQHIVVLDSAVEEFLSVLG